MNNTIKCIREKANRYEIELRQYDSNASIVECSNISGYAFMITFKGQQFFTGHGTKKEVSYWLTNEYYNVINKFNLR